MIAQHPQLVSTVVFAERLKYLSKKATCEGSSRIGSDRQQAQARAACEWIRNELRRRAAAALHDCAK
jgi:hypothetical protein